MSDLQIGLILLGVLLILAVLVFNWWQDRRIRRQMQAHFPERDYDPLMGADGSYASRREPGFAMDAAQDGPAAENDEDEVDAATEVVIDISFAQPVDAQQLHSAMQGLHQAGTKPVRLFATAEGGAHHARLRAQSRYTTLQLAVLLANRNGPLTDVEWSQLWANAQGIAELFDGHVEGPELPEVMAQAASLDAVFAGLDAQVGLVLALREAQDPDALAVVLGQAGFTGSGQSMFWPDEKGEACFSVLFDGRPMAGPSSTRVSQLDLVLDLPNSPPHAQAFSRMAAVGRKLAAQVGAMLLDDQGQPLPEHTDGALDRQLQERYERLAQAGYPAGEPRTARVFS